MVTQVFFFYFVSRLSTFTRDKLWKKEHMGEPKFKLLQSPVVHFPWDTFWVPWIRCIGINSIMARRKKRYTVVCLFVCEWADKDEDTDTFLERDSEVQWLCRQRLIKGERKLQRLDEAHHTELRPRRLSVVAVSHSLPDLPIARSSNHCKTDSLKSAVSERTHTRVSKWTTANYMIPCQLERDLGIKYLWGGRQWSLQQICTLL